MGICQLLSSNQQIIYLGELRIEGALIEKRLCRPLSRSERNSNSILSRIEWPALKHSPILSGGCALGGWRVMVRWLPVWSWSHKKCAESATIEANIAWYDCRAGMTLGVAMKDGVDEKRFGRGANIRSHC